MRLLKSQMQNSDSWQSNMDTSKLNEWQEIEEKTPIDIPAFSVDQQNNLHYEGMKTVEQVTKKKVALTNLVPLTCPNGEHYYQFMNGGARINGRVEVQCKACPVGQDFVVGLHQLVDGKIISNIFQ